MIPRAVAADGPAAMPGPDAELVACLDVEGLDQTRALVRVREHLANGANPSSKDNFGSTALHRAARLGYVDAGRALIDAGADLSAEDNWGSTPLSLAARERSAELVNLLIDAGSNLNAVSARANGVRPLFFAAPEMVSVLVARGADIEAVNAHGRSPLALTCEHIHTQSGPKEKQLFKDKALALIQAGAQVDFRNPFQLERDGDTLLRNACENHEADVA